MGILDEAIRQHLDLKRRQGAPDDELKRLEDEAFGPPTRPGEPDFPEEAPEGAGEEGGRDGPEAQAPTEAPVGEVDAPEQAPSGSEESTEMQPAAPTEPEGPPTEAQPDLRPEDAGGEAALFDHVEEGEPGPGAGAPPAEAPGPAEPPIESLPTVEHPMEDAIDEPPPEEGAEPEDSGAQDAEGADDVLEETPEFLKDAPEDDELWFEQREPKDFDF